MLMAVSNTALRATLPLCVEVRLSTFATLQCWSAAGSEVGFSSSDSRSSRRQPPTQLPDEHRGGIWFATTEYVAQNPKP